MTAAAAARPEAERVELWFMAEARVGQKGRTTHLWYQRGVRPPGAHAVGFASTWLFAAACPEQDAAVALVLPEVATAARNRFLAEVGAAVPPEAHAVLVLDRAGWHTGRSLAVPANLTLVHLPPYSPELNPTEKIWQLLRERFLSHRVFRDLGAVIAAACAAWNRLVAEHKTANWPTTRSIMVECLNHAMRVSVGSRSMGCQALDQELDDGEDGHGGRALDRALLGLASRRLRPGQAKLRSSNTSKPRILAGRVTIFSRSCSRTAAGA